LKNEGKGDLDRFGDERFGVEGAEIGRDLLDRLGVGEALDGSTNEF